MLCGTLVGVLAASPAVADGTPAGTLIENRATATFTQPGGGDANVNSNLVSLRVDEVLDVAVATADPGDVAVAPGANGVLRFTLTNSGNGTERFGLVAQGNAGGDDFDPVVGGIVLDANGNGAYDAGVDTAYVAGANDPELPADASLTVFVIAVIPAGATDAQRGRIDLIATSVTGTGAPGTLVAGQGQGGGDAIVGLSGGRGEDDSYLRVTQASLAFVKSATVVDPFGQSSAMPGATITYRLDVTVSGSGSLANLRLSDPIPAGTTYRAGTLTLDGNSLSDADDIDAGRFTGTGIAVVLGDVAAGAAHSVTFQVRID